jgi:hypothetical protein
MLGWLGQNVTAFAWLPDGSLLLAVADDFYLAGLNRAADRRGINVAKSDILRFEPMSLGENTAGSWSLYFDGSDVELTTPQEGIDALTVLADGRIVISTNGPVKAGGVNAVSRDLIVFTPTSLGEHTAGSWALYFNGSDVGLLSASNQSIVAVHQDETTSDLYLVTSSADGLVWVCSPTTLGDYTDCTFTVFWDGTVSGLSSGFIEAIAIR